MGTLATVAYRRAPDPRKHDTRASGPQAGLTEVNRRAHIIGDVTMVTGGRNHDGAAALRLAGERRWHSTNLRYTGYQTGMVLHRGAAGFLAGDESLRRWRSADTEMANDGRRATKGMSGRKV